ncbi:MAG: lysine transporter LysE [Bacteroidetes bacterium MedPE-SWsnd-G2]|nr:MAG: lysine transporter LysE [Bacteroidetes bacterium MedPE-SWsnd-G2]
MIDDILTAIPFGILLSFTIGPVFFVLLETSATKGFKCALVFDLGVVLADIVFIMLAFYSTNWLVEKVKDEPYFFAFGGILLIVYGIISFIQTSKSFRSIVKEYNMIDAQKDYLKLFVKGFLLNFVNIGVLLGWLGFVVIASSITTSPNGKYVFIGTMVVSYFVTDLIKIVVAKSLKNKLTPKRIFKIKKIVSLVILGFGILLLVQGFFPKEKEMLKKKWDEMTTIESIKKETLI